MEFNKQAVMTFERDDQKNQTNIKKHGISFEEACGIFKYPRLTARDERFEYGEIRENSVGKVSSEVIVVIVHTTRDKNIRIISARKANTREKEKYNAYIKTKTR